MSYRKKGDNHSNWKSYCNKNQKMIEKLNLPEWTFFKESNFREFVTIGQIDENHEKNFDFSTIENELFWELFYFIQNYFEMNAILFEKFEKARLNR